MIIIYLLVVLAIVKLFHFLNKSASTNKEQISFNSDEYETDLETSIEKPKEFGKNKWLHPADEFGKMEEGVSDYETNQLNEKKKEDQRN